MPFSPARNRSWNRPAYVAGGGSVTDLTQLYWYMNLDGRTNGAAVVDSGISYGDTVVVDGSFLYNGHKTAKHTITSTTNPDGDEVDLRNVGPASHTLVEGDEYWFTRVLYIPSTIDLSAGGNLKWIRGGHVTDASTNNIGWMDLYITDATTKQMAYQCEFATGGSTREGFDTQADAALRALNYKWPMDTWVAIQFYCKLNHVDGSGIVRMWADNTPIYENTSLRTMTTSADICIATYWQDFWNAGMPPGNVGQNMWATRYAFAMKAPAIGRDDSTLLATDSRGNKYIKMV